MSNLICPMLRTSGLDYCRDSNFNILEIERQFREAMIAVALTPPDYINASGELYRFYVVGDKRGSQNGWYVLYLDGMPSGAFGNWKTGGSYRWCIKSPNKMNTNEYAEYRRKIDDAFHLRNQAKMQQQQKAAETAYRIWSNALFADSRHPYLVKKNIHPFIARQVHKSLILPVTNFNQRIMSLQFISPDGSKKLLYGGAKKSHFIQVNGAIGNSQLLICEGFATASTLALAYPDACVIAAIDVGNIEHVAVEARRRWSHLEVIICCDDDRQTVGNPGLTKGRNAAVAAGALLARPQWPVGAPDSLSDFNDLACWLVRNKEVMV